MDKAKTATQRQLTKAESRINRLFNLTKAEIKTELEKYLGDFAEEDKANLALVKKYSVDKESKEYKDALKKLKDTRSEKLLYTKRANAQTDQYTQMLLDTQKLSYAIVNNDMQAIYQLNYNFISQNVQRVGDKVGISFNLIDSNVLKNLLLDKKITLPRASIKIAKTNLWNKQKIKDALTTGILKGESMDKIADRMANVAEMNKAQAIRTARTLVTSCENQGRNDRHNQEKGKFKKYGYEIRKKWDSTDDSRTRHSHLNAPLGVGNTYADEKTGKFSNGLRFPADIENGSYEDYMNCRCTLIEEVIDITTGEIV